MEGPRSLLLVVLLCAAALGVHGQAAGVIPRGPALRPSFSSQLRGGPVGQPAAAAAQPAPLPGSLSQLRGGHVGQHAAGQPAAGPGPRVGMLPALPATSLARRDAEGKLLEILRSLSPTVGAMHYEAELLRLPSLANGSPSVAALLDFLEEASPPPSTFDRHALSGDWTLEYTNDLQAIARQDLPKESVDALSDLAVVMTIGDTGVMNTRATFSFVGGERKVVTLQSLMTQTRQSPSFSVDCQDGDHVSLEVTYMSSTLVVFRKNLEGKLANSLYSTGVSPSTTQTLIWKRLERGSTEHGSLAGGKGLWRFGLPYFAPRRATTRTSIVGRPSSTVASAMVQPSGSSKNLDGRFARHLFGMSLLAALSAAMARKRWQRTSTSNDAEAIDSRTSPALPRSEQDVAMSVDGPPFAVAAFTGESIQGEPPVEDEALASEEARFGRRLFGSLLGLVASGAAPIEEAFADAKGKWDYKNEAKDWKNAFPLCEGVAQSPIGILRKDIGGKSDDTITRRLNYKPVDEREIYNNGQKNVQVNGNFGSFKLPDGEYEVKQFHFHFPAEHEINGDLPAGELHIVHQKKGSSGTKDLAVIGIFLEEKEDVDESPEKNFLEQLGFGSELPGKRSITTVGTLDLNDFGNEYAGGFYHYTGSLTTPPCSEEVHWYVMQRGVPVTRKMISSFKARFPGNNRPVQKLNTRYLVFNDINVPGEFL